MTPAIITQIILFGIALAMDAFAVSVTDSLIYTDLNKKRTIFIPAVFAFMQALMPLVGFFIVELVSYLVGENAGVEAGKIMALVVTWISFGLLLFIGGKMLIEGIKSFKEENENDVKLFSIKEVLVMGVATSIDALAVGVSLHAGLSTTSTIFLHVSIIMVVTFVICIIGILLGSNISKLFKGKHQATVIIGGIILILLAVWIVISHYVGS